MPNYPVVATSQGLGEVLSAQVQNLGITPTSKGLGELQALLANSASGNSALGLTEYGLTGLTTASLPVIAQSLSRPSINTVTQAITASTTLYAAPVYLLAGQVINNLGIVMGTTATGTPTTCYFVLMNSSSLTFNNATYAAYTPLAATANNTSTVFSASAVGSLPIASTVVSNSATSFTVPVTGLYYIGFALSAGTIAAQTLAATIIGLTPALSFTATVTAATVPTLGTALTVTTGSIGFLPYCIAF